MLEALASLPWLRPALDALRLLTFATFVGLGIAAARAPERRRVDRLLAFVLGVTLVVGLTQVEAWPFTNWALVHHPAPARITSWELEGMDAAGRVWPVDARVLQPLAPEEFGAWMLTRVERLPAASRERLGAFLLERAEAGRRSFRERGVVGTNRLVLGPLAAPFHFEQKHVWRTAGDAPATPLVAVRIARLEWDVEERARDESKVARRVVLQHPQP